MPDLEREEKDGVAVYKAKREAAPGVLRRVFARTIVPADSEADEEIKKGSTPEGQAAVNRYTAMLKNVPRG